MSIRTKKIKKDKTKNLWDTFDKEIKGLNCIYDNKNNDNSDICKHCNSILKLTDEGFMVCSNSACGIMTSEAIDNTAEWRYYGADDNSHSDPTRCGMPINPLLQESSFGCKVLCLGSSTSYEMRKIKRYTEWQSMPYKEKTQYDEFQHIILIAQNANIPKIIIDDAMRYYKQLSEHKTFRGLNRHGIIAASIYISCKKNDNPRTPKEIAQIFNLDNTSTTKGCKNASGIMNILETNNEVKTTLSQTTPENFIDRYCSRLNINDELTKVCRFVAKKIEKQKIIPENTPPSIAAGIIYCISQVCNLNITKKNIFQITGTSEVTINKCAQKLISIHETLIPTVILKKYN